MEKVSAKLKQIPEDFRVEEIGDKWACKTEEKFTPKKPDLKNIEDAEPKTFLWLELEKRNIDHFKTIKIIAERLNKDVKDIGYAGTKDKAAITSQRISIQNPNTKKLKEFYHPKIILKNPKWNKRKIKMGYLNENRFKITLRDLDKKDAIKISNKISKTKTFPNYFGAQRFGTLRKNNVEIGKLILKREFKSAIDRILTDTSENENEEITKARLKLKKEKDYKKAQKYFPETLKLEHSLLKNLSRKPKDYINAIKYANRKNMLMYVHAVQSKMFNEILSHALEQKLDFKKEGHKNCLLIGYKSRFFEGPLGEIEKEVLKENSLTLQDFNIIEIPYLRIKGSFRKALTEVKNLKTEIKDDELTPPSKKIILEFTLPSGVYATTFLSLFFSF